MSPSNSSKGSSTPADSRRSALLQFAVIISLAVATLTSPVSAIDSSAGVAAVDQLSGFVVGTNEKSVDPAAVNGASDDADDDVDDRRFAALFGQKNSEDETDFDEVDKRKSKVAAFRSDLGKRDLNDEDDDSEFDAEKRTYRSRGGKAFKADLGKRVRGGSMFRSDLGRRSDPSMTSFDRNSAANRGRNLDSLVIGVSSSSLEPPAGNARAGVGSGSHGVDRRRSMFRSDLGKRSTRGDSVRRMFRADLGKRRVSFRHDLG